MYLYIQAHLDHEEDGRSKEEGEELVQAGARRHARELEGLGEGVHVVVLFVFVGRWVCEWATPRTCTYVYKRIGDQL